MNTPSAGLRISLLGWMLAQILGVPAPAAAAESYYLLVFGSQLIPPRAKYSHSFAAFVRACGPGPCGEGGAWETHTISWMPRSLDIRLCAVRPECGQNLELEATLRWAFDTDQRVSMWGPYRIEPDLYNRALKQECLLQSGTVRYKALDTGYSSDVAFNCIHAVSSIVGGYRTRVISPSFGETASYYITRRMEPWILEPGVRHDWVAHALGLDQYPIIRRELEPPRSGLFWGAVTFGRSQKVASPPTPAGNR